MSFEAVVVRHPDLFTAAAVERSKARLAAQVTPEGFD